ncbi:DMT family transporter [Roseateles violae]|uniref:DMT family transporter n=1 Tax=Roseateles violae TaxID=3058042 RepID=A0ABT8DU89_9BURK|nr:DMT family transporter [Pelomonas sp. PFR6]MDN3921875.1 DMT family transporter [Pelomonas sp. PFR6]
MLSTLSTRLPHPRRDPFAALAAVSGPLLFILLWSSGYVAGRLGLAHSGPFTLLSLRFGIAALLLALLALAGDARWPRGRHAWGHLAVAGLLMQVLHFSGIYYGLRLGLSAGVAGLLIGLMPLATALGAQLWLAERLGRRQALALLGGLLGVALVVAGKPLQGDGGWPAYAAALLGLVGLVAGTLYQKRFCAQMDLRSGAAVQMAVSALAVAVLAGPVEGFALRWSGELVFAVLWLALVNSIGAFSLMFLMMRRGQAAQVARLFYLIPGMSALLGFLLLDERLPVLALLGFALSAAAVCVAAAKHR